MSSNYRREGDHIVETIGKNVAYTLGLEDGGRKPQARECREYSSANTLTVTPLC